MCVALDATGATLTERLPGLARDALVYAAMPLDPAPLPPSSPAPTPVAPGIYPLVEPLDGRRLVVVLVVGARGALLVDTGVAGTPAATVLPALAALGLEPADLRHVVITHSDVDHSGGLGALLEAAPAATAIAHRLDVPWIDDVELLIDGRYRALRHEHELDAEQGFLDWVRASDTGGAVELAVEGGELLRLGAGRDLELVHVPGHSRGHLAVVDRLTGTGLIGDAVFGAVTPDLAGNGAFAPAYYDVASYRGAVARLQALGLERLVGAHYPVLEGDEAAQFLLESAQFCDRLEAAVGDALAAAPEPLTIREVVAASAPAVRAWPEKADLSLCAPVLGHLDDLGARGQAERIPGSPARWTAAS